MQPVRIYECTVVDASPRATATWPDPPAPPAGWPRAGWTANTWSVLLGLAIAAAPLVPFSLAIAETATRTCPGRWWPASSPAPQCSASAPPSCLRGTYAGGTRSRRSAPRHSSATAQPPVVGAKGERAEATPTSRSDASATNWATIAVRDPRPRRGVAGTEGPGCRARCQSVGTMLAASLADMPTRPQGLDSTLWQPPQQRGIHYRRCSQRQGRGEALVSEWFVSEGRYTDTEAAPTFSRS
jgi:hypothetical protein